MKKFFITAAVSAILFSCGGGGSNDNKETATPAKEEAKPAANPLEDKAVELIAKSDCLTCHKVHETSTGPAYADVAKKYPANEANIKMLVEKIQKGGKGNWGEVPMLAHPDVSKEDATTMVQYILSIKN